MRVGFIQLTDAAPLIVAAEAGLFAAVGLDVQLSRELGWGSIQDRLLLGELDYIHALSPMPLAASIGSQKLPTECVGLMPLSHNGNGITITRKWWDQGIRSGEEFAAFVRQEKWRRRFTFGVVSPASCHNFLLRQWLRSIDLKPDKDVEIVNLPPGQFLRNLQAHTIDGACVGEPWNTLAVEQGIGWCVATSLDCAPGHLEKTIMTTRESLERDPDTAARLVGAVTVACEWFARPDFIPTAARLLARSPYLQMPARVIEDSLRPGVAKSSARSATGIHFGEGATPEFALEELSWLEAGLRECALLDEPVPGGRLGLTRFYPSSVVKNAQPYAKLARAQAFAEFFSIR